MKLSVVILNYNVRYFLELCLKSVEQSLDEIDAEIIVVDNNSTDDSVSMVSQLFPKVHLIINKENIGFSKANNIGVEHAKGEYICILNPDTMVTEDTFKELLRFADITPNLGIVGCQLIDGSGAFLLESKRNIPYPKVALKKLLGNDKDYYASTISRNSTAKVDILVGAFMLLKRSVYQEVFGFDEDYFMYGEDIDLSYKVLKNGFDNYYYGKTTILHFKGESTQKNIEYIKRFYGAMKIFYHKNLKTNPFFGVLVNIGIYLVSLLKKPTITKKVTPKHYYLFSQQNTTRLQERYNMPMKVYKDFTEAISDNSLVIIDLNDYSIKAVLEFMKKMKRIKDLQFSFIPKGSYFTVGSNNSEAQGEIVKF